VCYINYCYINNNYINNYINNNNNNRAIFIQNLTKKNFIFVWIFSEEFRLIIDKERHYTLADDAAICICVECVFPSFTDSTVI